MHRLMEERPGEAVAWYAAGCYYMACGQVCATVAAIQAQCRLAWPCAG
jgi:hypothetical protein